MIAYPIVHTVRDAGFKVVSLNGPQDHWVIVGQWDQSCIRQCINATIQLQQLISTFGPRRCGELFSGEYRIIVADESDDVEVLIQEQHSRYADQGMIDDAEYWNQIGPLVEDVWTGMPLSERARLLKRLDEEDHLVFADASPPNLFSEIVALVEET